jgi:hypothetical protein
MTTTAFWYGLALVSAFGGATEPESYNIDWLTDTINVALVSDSYTPNQDTDQFWSDVVAYEVSGIGYTADGETLIDKTVTYTGSTNTLKLDAGDVVWADSTISARYAVVYKVGGTEETSPLLGYIDYGVEKESVTGPFIITWATAGILTITPA